MPVNLLMVTGVGPQIVATTMISAPVLFSFLSGTRAETTIHLIVQGSTGQHSTESLLFVFGGILLN